jgi:GDP-mannose 6-dehydrogenase
MNFSIFGLGYVGAVTAACLTRNGHSVIGVDINEQKVADFASGLSPIVEPEVPELLATAFAAGRLSATSDTTLALGESDASIICVGTPSRPNGELDLSFVQTVSQQIASALSSGNGRCRDVIFRSTMLPGSTTKIAAAIFDSLAPNRRPRIWFFPEFLREGTAVADYQNPALTVVGHEGHPLPETLRCLAGDTPDLTDFSTAELIKYACNAFHATKVAFANEIGRLGKHFSIDSRKVMALLCSDHRLNISPVYLRPGNPFGGSCLPKDVSALSMLARREGLRTPLLDNLLGSNDDHSQALLTLIERRPEKEVVILGLTFKNNTDDLRHSPMVAIAQHLLGHGYKVRIYDPNLAIERLMGRNETLIMTRMPHLAELLNASLESALGESGIILAAHQCADLQALSSLLRPAHHVFDINGWPGLREIAPSYEGLCW